MKAVLLHKFGGVEELYMGETPAPVTADQEVLVKVRATALNRADLLQRKGLYPPPPGESEILGLEMAGEIVSSGTGAGPWKPGDRVFALLSGGGYAEYVKVHKDMLMPIPDKMGYEEAAGVAEAFLTAWQALVWRAELKSDENILIHAGASGVGTAAIQIAKNRGAVVWVTASGGKHDFCRDLGATHCIDYREVNFAKTILAKEKSGIEVVIDFIGASYFTDNIDVLAVDGRMVMLGFLGGTVLEKVNLAPLLFKRLKIMGSTLRSRSLDYKILLTRHFVENGLPLLKSGVIKPVIDAVFPWTEVQQSHTYMEANKNMGKIILQIN